ncbi:hypothetical protein [Lichenibacterium dinghuense]|uniref:hypothetical protein n=1 Tax=Lichenibacterium dinghuense TaxID=2895977 RepID=UPI001F4055A5|nr:hypothetical protein [Lichenibacterium sp. 6Y81]
MLDVARLLASSQVGPPNDAMVRRSISTAYYALFHTVLEAGADRFFGAHKRAQAGHAILYRSFDHGRMKRVCEDAARSSLAPTLQRQLRRTSFDPGLRRFAGAFVLLQASRHAADYDPAVRLQHEDALAAIGRAEQASTSFAAAPDDERSDLLALMLGGGRS